MANNAELMDTLEIMLPGLAEEVKVSITSGKPMVPFSPSLTKTMEYALENGLIPGIDFGIETVAEADVEYAEAEVAREAEVALSNRLDSEVDLRSDLAEGEYSNTPDADTDQNDQPLDEGEYTDGSQQVNQFGETADEVDERTLRTAPDPVSLSTILLAL
jgi:hypothetical protein